MISYNKAQKLIEKDIKYIWHPCSQMKDYEIFPPIPVESANGPYLITKEGRKIIDAISSWWCKSLGHGHPKIREAVFRQIKKFEHIIGANTCNEILVMLSERLCSLIPGADKIFYADNGSIGIEVAMKMSLQYHCQTGHPEKKLFASLKNGYHGETILTLAAGDCDLYSKPFVHILPEIKKIQVKCYITGEDDEAWEQPETLLTEHIESEIKEYADRLSAIIFEPILQGAGGMLIYSPFLLRALKRLSEKYKFHLIADEILTGFGRTGKMFACEYANIVPDFTVVSKGLTAGWGPMSAVLCSTEVYNAFYDDYLSGKSFLHSNTYTGYAITAAAALAALKVYEKENIPERVYSRSGELKNIMEFVASETNALTNIRNIGFVCAGDIIDPNTGEKFQCHRRMGFRFYREAVKNGALLRPLGDTIYFLPPLNIENTVLEQLGYIAAKSLLTILQDGNESET